MDQSVWTALFVGVPITAGAFIGMAKSLDDAPLDFWEQTVAAISGLLVGGFFGFVFVFTISVALVMTADLVGK